MPYITIFTPVYNRAHTLERLYKSLTRQSYKDFEWVVVDDGSTDKSIEMVCGFIQNSPSFKIRLVKNNHGGKHRAVNTGLRTAAGKLFLILDSDDWLTDDALATVVKWEAKIPIHSKCAGLCGCNQAPNGKMISKGLLKEYVYMPLTEMIKIGITGDRTDVLYTDLFRRYPYPEIPNEYHIAPGVPFIRISNDGYNLLFFNEVICIQEYRADGLTAMGDKKSLDNFEGYTIRSRELLASDIGLKRKLEILVKYGFLSKEKKISISDVSKRLNIGKLLAMFGRILGIIYSVVRRK